MRTRIIHTKIWKDSYFFGLTPVEKLLFVYFITNENVNIIHLYELPEHQVLFDTGVELEDYRNSRNKFQANKKIYFYVDYVYLVNASRYEKYEGRINEMAKQKLYSQLPKDVLDWYYSISDTPQIGVYIPSINKKSEIIINKSEIRNKKEDMSEKGLEKLRETAAKLKGIN